MLGNPNKLPVDRSQARGQVPGGGVLRISRDGEDQRIFLGLKFSIPEFFWVGEFGKYFVCVCVARFK